MAEGGDFPTVNLRSIAPHLTCILCTEPLATGTRVCDSGHTFCKNCLPDMDRCLECRTKIRVGTRNYPIEKIAALVKYKCHNFYFGCKTLLSKEIVVDHNVTCPHSTISCPLAQVNSIRCQWIGRLFQTLDHVKEYHSNKIRKRNYFTCTSLGDTYCLIVYKEELFLYLKQKRDYRWYAAVMSVGVTRGTFRGVFILKSFEKDCSNEAVEISFTVDFIVTFEKIFNYGRCLILEDESVANFVKDGKMNMVVSIEEISKK
jgi:hypothetical protein